jgi:hypothetical protein
MNEWDEVAEGMLAGYKNWLQNTRKCRTLDNARDWVKQDRFMGEESAQMRDNVAHALHRLSGRVR